MRAVIFHGPRNIRLEERPIPTPGTGQVVVKLGAALTCGTDFKAFRQGHRVLLGDYPSPFGHELAGTVCAVGAGVQNAREGDRVVVANSAPMDDCFWCRNGQNQLCPRLKLHNGAYADYDLVPEHIVRGNLHALADGVPFERGALAESLSCAIHAVEAMAAREGERALVIGAGPMGLLLIQALRAAGVRVGALGRSKSPLETAREAGAEAIFSSNDSDPREAIKSWAEGRGPDLVFEAVGRPETYLQAVALVRDGGKVCLFGGCAPETVVPFDAHRLHYRQISLHGVFHHNPRHFKVAIRLLADGAIRDDLLVQGSIGVAEVPAFFSRNADKSAPKTVVLP